LDDLNAVISTNLAQLRRQKGLTLDKLADLSGVSKAMIGQIERSESNPTVNTLWKIASGLRVPFGKLIATNKLSTELVKMNQLEPISDEDGMRLYTLFSGTKDNSFEIFSVTLAPHCVHSSDAHADDSEEYVLLTQGNLELVVDTEIYQLTAGDSIHFQCDRLHTYRNTTNQMACFQIIIYHP